MYASLVPSAENMTHFATPIESFAKYGEPVIVFGALIWRISGVNLGTVWPFPYCALCFLEQFQPVDLAAGWHGLI